MSKYSTALHLRMVLAAIEEVFGHLPNGLGTGEGENANDSQDVRQLHLIAEAMQLREQVYASGYADGLLLARRGWRKLDSYGRASEGVRLNKTQTRDVDELVQIEKWSDPIKRRPGDKTSKRKRGDLVRVKSSAKIER